MDIYEECKKASHTTKTPKMDILLGELPKKDAESLKQALLDEVISSTTIQRVLMENGIKMGKWSILEWRRLNKAKSTATETRKVNK